jgi:RimJ/RimL family protein N-acetyltransferase
MVIQAEPFGAGLIGFKGIPDKNGEVEIGYGIDPPCRRLGYTTEAAGALINWALQQATCLSVTAWSDKSNRASARVLEKVGMQIARETTSQYCWVRS